MNIDMNKRRLNYISSVEQNESLTEEMKKTELAGIADDLIFNSAEEMFAYLHEEALI